VLAGAHVLVIENVELLLNSLTRTLAGWGCQVRSARNMREAIQEARAQWPDLVVSDHHLGDREPNGIELIQALRQQGQREGRPALRALLMTGDVSAQLESLAHDSGVRVLHKPVRPQLLRASLVELVASPAGSLGSHPG
jgi:CheY-like chemotaxis protein